MVEEVEVTRTQMMEVVVEADQNQKKEVVEAS